MITFACKTCAATDPAAFYAYQPRECKECTKRRVRKNRAANVDHYRAFDRARGNDPARKVQFAAKQRRKRAKGGSPYMRAHNMVRRAIEKGTLVRPDTCSRCPATVGIQAHHDDHAKPLDVMWLCPVCHAARHKELGRLSRLAEAYGDQPEPF